MKIFLILLFFIPFHNCLAQAKQPQKIPPYISKVWVADLGNGMYKNPIINADYSDPDAIRVGNDYYLVSSSFEDIPGLPILHSTDLVNWTIVGHALLKQPPYDIYAKTQHGAGVWAPAIRYHAGEFYIYYPDPDYGIYVVKTKKPAGPWSLPVLVEGGKGLIDPCPLWDDDGQAYLVHAYAGSRAGIKSIAVIKKLSADGMKIIDDGKLVYDGHETDPTFEGPKLYKRNGWYYIFAPAGGVPTGWQLALRSRDIYGPYERKVVMDQGSSATNGPHQGAWVTTQTGEDWFLHFQDKDAYGRVVHLQPMKWINDWPVIGIDKDGDGKGEPVMTYKKPNVSRLSPVGATKRSEGWERSSGGGFATPPESDEFNTLEIGKQWQWMGNPKTTWAFTNVAKGALRLYSDRIDSVPNLWFVPNVLLQKFPAEEFMATTKMTFTPNNTRLENEKAGLTIMGFNYANISLKSKRDGMNVVFTLCNDADNSKTETEQVIEKATSATVYFRVVVKAGGKCRFSYSWDGSNFTNVGEEFTAKVGRWKGAKMGLFCTRQSQINDSGFADFDWFRVEAVY